MRVFNLIWIGQITSLTGSAVTTFGLGVWVYQATGSATYYGTLVLLASLPGLLVLPLAGTLVDRWDRRRALLFSAAGAAVLPLAVAALSYAQALRLWHVYLLVTVAAVFTAFQWPALSALVPEVVPQDRLGKANARLGFADAAGRIVGAALGGGLYVAAGLGGLLILDIASFAVAVVTLAIAGRLLRGDATVTAPAPVTAARRSSLRQEIPKGWAFLRQRPGLLGLQLFFAKANLAMEFAIVLIPPLVLSRSTPGALGMIEAIGWSGMLLGGAYLSVGRQPRRRVATILAITAVQGALVIMAGAGAQNWVIATAMFGILLGYSVVGAAAATLWQLKTPRELQGRVFALRRMIAWSTEPIAYGLAGPLVETVFTPLVGAGGPLAGTVGRITGSGQGAGISLAFMVMGAIVLTVTAATCLRTPVRRLEQDLPDAPRAEPAMSRVTPTPSEEMAMTDEDQQTYKVVLNHEEQYSIWPVDRANPGGWRDEGTSGSKSECLEHINKVWTDMRPLSLRMASRGQP